jgi:hypothetical protein
MDVSRLAVVVAAVMTVMPFDSLVLSSSKDELAQRRPVRVTRMNRRSALISPSAAKPFTSYICRTR